MAKLEIFNFPENTSEQKVNKIVLDSSKAKKYIVEKNIKNDFC